MLEVIGCGWIIARFAGAFERHIEIVYLMIRNTPASAQYRLDEFMCQQKNFVTRVGLANLSAKSNLKSIVVPPPVTLSVVALAFLRDDLNSDLGRVRQEIEMCGASKSAGLLRR
jgi:hypothetical protein